MILGIFGAQGQNGNFTTKGLNENFFKQFLPHLVNIDQY